MIRELDGRMSLSCFFDVGGQGARDISRVSALSDDRQAKVKIVRTPLQRDSLDTVREGGLNYLGGALPFDPDDSFQPQDRRTVLGETSR